MDGDRFDGLSRRLATGHSRREVLTGVAVGLLGMLGLRTGPATAAQTSQVQCGNVACANNPGNCNPGCVCCVYTNSITGTVINSRCRPPGTCSPGAVVCPAGKFVDPALGCVQCRSTADCPAPSGPCQTTTCVAGVCGTSPVPAGAPGACPASTVACKLNACTAAGVCGLQNTPNNTTCAGGFCLDGACVPPASTTCEQPSDLCQYNVFNPQTSTCVTISSCFPDACEEVPAGYCNYIVGETNRANIRCSYASKNFGACDQPGGCSAGTTCCGGQCRNLSCDTANCGECGYNCITRENPNGSDRFDFGNACAAGRCFHRPDGVRSPII